MRSMTGFGRSEKTISHYQVSVEIKSVNHRYLDLRFRLPSSLSPLESQLGETIRKTCERGSFEIVIRQKFSANRPQVEGNTRFVVDQKALQSFMEAVDWLQKNHKVTGQPDISNLVSSGRILIPVDDGEENTLQWETLRDLVEVAVKELIEMRESEGKKIKTYLDTILDEILAQTNEIKLFANDQPKKIHEKLQTRLSKWQLSEPLDPSRLAWEVAMLAEKADITEEIDRLTAHVAAFKTALKQKNSIGRRLDFLTQELLRECNTVASKASLLEITNGTVQMKAQIERLREQVQNVE